ncbi:MFS transporter [Arthrobacter sp. Ld5]|uniref:MFS transporter n=1 Tax=Arthrobacter sp. Ld5 TaxID=649152 RepID=UPI003EB9376E
MSHKQILQALTGLLAGLFTAILSSTIVANALPTIMSDLDGSQTDFAWVITAALLANAATTPIWGKFADLFDKKVLVQLSIVIFVAGSVLAGFAQTIPLLLAARVVQGVAMGGLTALAQAIIGTIIAPRERGRYSGYMGGVMAVATAGGPLLGGFIVDSPLGWRWTFFVCVPLAIIALVLLQITLKLPDTRRKASIDWLGSILLTAGVSLILIWVSFAGKEGYYEWFSRESALMVGGSVVLLALLLVVESKVAEPIIPLAIISQRTTALAIIASITVGIAMFASSSYLGQYYQVARGATPTEAGLLTMPMIAGNLLGSIGAGLLVTRFGKWKRFLIAGSLFLIVGLGLAGTIDHLTELWVVGVYTFVFGLGLGLLLQNLVLAVQNTVAVKDIGTASASVAFFRSMGGAAGVAVLGAILGTQVENRTTEGLAAAGIPVSGGAAGGSLDLVDLPAPIAEIVRAAYGDSTALIFLITAVIAVVGLVCVLFIRETPLRRTVDFAQAAPAGPAASMSPAATGTTPSVAGAQAGSPVGAGSAEAPSGSSSGVQSAGVPSGSPSGTEPAGAPAQSAADESDVVAVQPSHGRHSAGPVEIRRADVGRAARELGALSAQSEQTERTVRAELSAPTELDTLDTDLEDRAGAGR